MEETEHQKIVESKKGKQFVENTPKAKEARKGAGKNSEKSETTRTTRSKQAKRQTTYTDESADEYVDQSVNEDHAARVESISSEEADPQKGEPQNKNKHGGQKRGRKQDSAPSPNKKQKDNAGKGSKTVNSRKHAA